MRSFAGIVCALAVALAICLSGCVTPATAGTIDTPEPRVALALTGERYADSHAHLIDFLQNGAFDNRDGYFEGIGPRGEIPGGNSVRYLALPYGEQWRRLTLFLSDMDAAGVEQSMITGMPFLKKWSENEPFARPRYYLDSSSHMVRARDTDYLIGTAVLDYRQHFSEDPEALRHLDRLHPFVCGFDGTDLGAVDLVIKRIKEFPGVWQGIGEVMSRHDDLTNLTTGDRPRGNHPSLKRIGCFAGDYALPVSIHHNMAPISRSQTEVKDPVYLDELVELFEYCRPPHTRRATRFIWCHAGVSRRIVVGNLPHWIDAVLKQYEGQVFIDLSWVVYEDYIEKDPAAWASLVRKYPKSFMLGSDVVGGGEGLAKEVHRYRPFLDAISPDPNDPVRRGLASQNFERLMDELAAERQAILVGEGLLSADAAPPSGLLLKSTYEYDSTAHTGVSGPSFVTRNRPKPAG